MSFRRKILYQLVHLAGISNAEAKKLLEDGAVCVSGKTVYENRVIGDNEEIALHGRTLRSAKDMVYLRFYKPVGYESSLSRKVVHHLADFFSHPTGLSIAGRLDKASEGLLLVSNDGAWIERIINPKYHKEKEYIVQLDKEPDQFFLERFRGGVDLHDFCTQPCFCESLGNDTIKVILKEGKNRQIRRMCRALGYQVLRLKRVRIGEHLLEDMEPGEIRFLNN